MSELPLHPRLAHMLIRSKDLGHASLACDIAALLEERDILRGQKGVDVDFTLRHPELTKEAHVDRGARSRVRAEARRLRGLLGINQELDASAEKTGLLLALAYPERVARRRAERGGRYQMAGGTGAILPEWSLLAREEFLAIAEVDGVGTEVRVFLAAPVQKPDLLEVFADHVVSREEVFWDEKEEMVVARHVRMFNTLIVEEQNIPPAGDAATTSMAEGIAQMGLACLPWDAGSVSLRSRSEWLRQNKLVADDWPDLSDGHLLSTIDRWLQPFLNGITRRAHLQRIDVSAVLTSLFSHTQRKDLDRLAPVVLTVPTGSRIRVDYSAGAQPILAVRLQEMFGQTDTPLIAGGQVRVLIHLLSPAGRPLAVTQDLRSFWANAYPDVRKEMRGRYPKHQWPEDPLHAEPTRRTKRHTRNR